MKTLIKTYYREPQVDTNKIMKTLFTEKKSFSWNEIFLVPIVGMAVLLGVFGIFLFDLNIAFLSTGISVYSAIGGMLFIILNVLIGMVVFILEHYVGLLLFSMILFFLQYLHMHHSNIVAYDHIKKI